MWELGIGDERGNTVVRGKEGPAEPRDAVEWGRKQLGFEPDREQALVLGSASKRGLLNCTRQWGKSTIAAAKAVYQASTEPESLTLVVSPSARQSGEFVRKAEGFARRLGMRVKGDGDNAISLEFPNQSRIVGLPGNEVTARGFSAVSLLLVDEASRVSDDLYKAIRPGPEGTPGGQLWGVVADEHAVREPGVLLGSVAARGAGMGAGAGSGVRVRADWASASGGGEGDYGG